MNLRFEPRHALARGVGRHFDRERNGRGLEQLPEARVVALPRADRPAGCSRPADEQEHTRARRRESDARLAAPAVGQSGMPTSMLLGSPALCTTWARSSSSVGQRAARKSSSRPRAWHKRVRISSLSCGKPDRPATRRPASGAHRRPGRPTRPTRLAQGPHSHTRQCVFPVPSPWSATPCSVCRNFSGLAQDSGSHRSGSVGRAPTWLHPGSALGTVTGSGTGGHRRPSLRRTLGAAGWHVVVCSRVR